MTGGSPFVPHTEADRQAMLDAVGVSDVEELFDVPASVRFDGDLDVPARSEAAVRSEVATTLDRNASLTEFLGRGHYDHYVPSVVDRISARSEFLTSYTQYQPEVAQGFLQALFEYQSMLVELTGLPIANASMYDAATALGEAALLASRVRDADGSTVLVPEYVRDERVSVLENYGAGAGISVRRVPGTARTLSPDPLADAIDQEVAAVYAETPTARGRIEESLGGVGDLAHQHDALFVVGSDPIAMALLEAPGYQGADVVIGDASVLGLPTSYGMGLGIFATKEDYLRQVPGRLVGASTDDAGRRAYTLTLQTREQHIRRERATSNICTNQAWVALRTAMHVAHLGPDGLIEKARRMVRLASDLADRLDGIAGIEAPASDGHYFREFVAETDRDAQALAADLRDRGFAIHAIDDHEVQVAVTETTADATDDLVAAIREVTA
ncbi:MAG: aminomethyl-transferring glycine dehydrogenase subunit GcvPA [Halanaeroarchaeum sp.]